MIGTLFKLVVVTLIVVLITGGIGLVIMAGVAGTHGVKKIDIPETSQLVSAAQAADYADAYRIPMEFVAYRDIHQVITNATIKGDGEVNRTENEVVFAGKAPGLRYQVSYLLDRSITPPTLAMVTTVKFVGDKGRWYWKAAYPVHRCLAPYMLDRLASRATD